MPKRVTEKKLKSVFGSKTEPKHYVEQEPVKETLAQKTDRYDALLKQIEEMPTTWYPAILKAVVETAKAKQVFKPGRISEFVRGIEEHGQIFTSALSHE